MVWKCPPLNLFNWSNLWKWKNEMTTEELIEALDQRYGNTYATDCALIQQGIKELSRLNDELNELRKGNKDET